jgi:hypothetical protein
MIGDDHVEAVMVKTLEETLADATHWSTRSMAKATGMSQAAVGRIWQAFWLKPEGFNQQDVSRRRHRSRGVLGVTRRFEDWANGQTGSK